MQTANEWILKGLAQGREEGRREGREEGREDGVRRVLGRILKSRFGDVPSELLARLDDVHELEHLDRLADAALSSPNLATFEQALPPDP